MDDVSREGLLASGDCCPGKALDGFVTPSENEKPTDWSPV